MCVCVRACVYKCVCARTCVCWDGDGKRELVSLCARVRCVLGGVWCVLGGEQDVVIGAR